MNPLIYSLISVLLVSFLSFVGVLFFAVKEEKLKKILLFLVSFAAGGLLGGAFFHLLPEAAEEGFNLTIALAILVGFLLLFVLEKFICWRHCHIPTSKEHPHPLAFMNLVGDGLHNFTDGIIIAASFLTNIRLGIATALAVIFHEIPQEIGDFGVLIHGGFSKREALFFNFASALMAVLGAVFTLFLGRKFISLIQFLIPFTAGGFIYIAGSDLIPELHKETNLPKSAFQLTGLLFGIGMMACLTLLE